MIAGLKSLFSYKELLLNFTRKELKVKYKNSVLGFFWSLLNPILMMLVFTVIFTIVLPIKNIGGITNFPLFFLAGFLPWNFFSATVTSSTTSIVGNGALIKKVFFPRELLPVSIGLANLVNFALELLVFFLFIIVTGLVGDPKYLEFYKFAPYLLILIPILFVFTIGVSLLVASLNVYMRDVQHFIGILLMVTFYATPIIYPISIVAERAPPIYLKAYKANPVTAIIESFHQVLHGVGHPSFNLLLYSAVVAVAVFLVGYAVFLRLEPAFAEEV